MNGHAQYTTASDQGRSQYQPPRPPPHARITAWLIRNCTNAERLVSEGIFCELAIGETRVCTAAEIAFWANVSEATVSRAMPGLVARGIIQARRVLYAETGRLRWELTRRAPAADGSFSPASVGSDMDATPQRVMGCEMPPEGVLMPQTSEGRNSASESLAFSPDPCIFLDSCKTQLASEPGASREDRPDPPAPPPVPPAPPQPAAPPPPPAHAELVARRVNPALATAILGHYPAMDGATFDALVSAVIRERPRARSPRGLVISLLAQGKRADLAGPAPGSPPAPAGGERVSDMPILTADHVSGFEKAAWLRRFRAADGPAAKRAILDQFFATFPPPTEEPHGAQRPLRPTG